MSLPQVGGGPLTEEEWVCNSVFHVVVFDTWLLWDPRLVAMVIGHSQSSLWHFLSYRLLGGHLLNEASNLKFCTFTNRTSPARSLSLVLAPSQQPSHTP